MRLKGITARDEDNGTLSFGRHATSIQMGRCMWETTELTSVEKRLAKEMFFGGASWPRTTDMSQPWPETEIAIQAAKKALTLDDKRPQPFEGKTEPYAHLTCVDYEARMQDWMTRVRKEKIAPTWEQMQVILRVKSRLLRE